jgi:hypothetical protein
LPERPTKEVMRRSLADKTSPTERLAFTSLALSRWQAAKKGSFAAGTSFTRRRAGRTAAARSAGQAGAVDIGAGVLQVALFMLRDS